LHDQHAQIIIKRRNFLIDKGMVKENNVGKEPFTKTKNKWELPVFNTNRIPPPNRQREVYEGTNSDGVS
jgi:hypothetical protein